MNITRASITDLPELTRLFDAYRVFYDQPSDLHRAAQFMKARLEKGDSVVFLARGASAQAVGFTQLYASFSSVSTAPIWILNDLYVGQEFRGVGAGAALLRCAQDFAAETGALRIELSTAHTNLAAQRLYERAGYQLDTVFRKYTLPIKG